jgi:hypothetical protein
MTYRDDARAALDRARTELASQDKERLRYAALELRFAVEALTYDRAALYKDDFPPSEYETWQPRLLMSQLLEIDPSADQDCTIAIGGEERSGVRAAEMDVLGTEKVFNMQMLKQHYDALGSYLHVPTLKQVKSGNHVDQEKLRARCETVAASVTNVLSSEIFNADLKIYSELDCVYCGTKIRKRLPRERPEIPATCFGCKNTYTLRDRGNGEVSWEPDQTELRCANQSCRGGPIFLPDKEVRPGKRWICKSCRGTNMISLAVAFHPAAESVSDTV